MSEHSAQAETHRAAADPPTDVQLILDLRDGDIGAYEELWRRHIGAALRQARRLTPHQPEDLAAEAFTTVFHQITVAGGGPDQNFRAYLFTVMRNLAIRWNRENRLILPLGESHDPVVDDGADRVIGDEDARIVLHAFRTLPARWQQVLWLAEVEEEPRPAIAARLTMSPNSVSALLRRARHGLRYQCLVEHVPEDLRTDRSHVARVLPDLVCGKLTPDTVVKVGAHLAGCATCREVHSGLRALSWRVKRATLGTLGFGALTMLVKDLGAAGVAAAAATGLAGTAAGGLMVGGPISTALKVAAATVGVVAVVVPVTGSVTWQPSGSGPAAAALPLQPATLGPTVGTPPPEPAASAPSVQSSPKSSAGETATPATDVHTIDLWHPASPAPGRTTPTPVEPGTLPGPAQPASPAIAEPTTQGTAPPAGEPGSGEPGSSDTTSTADPSPTPASEPSAGGQEPTTGTAPAAPAIAAVGTGTGYIAPTLTGAVESGATVAIQVTRTSPTATSDTTPFSAGATYAVVADASGAWSFDLSGLGLEAAGYQATVWQVAAGKASSATVMEFALNPLRVDGLPTEARMYNIDAEYDGIVITIVAPGQQQACLTANTGQEATIPLAADGTAARRIRFQGLGTFELEVAVCQDGRYGSPTRSTIIVEEKFATPWPVDLEPAIFVEEL